MIQFPSAGAADYETLERMRRRRVAAQKAARKRKRERLLAELRKNREEEQARAAQVALMLDLRKRALAYGRELAATRSLPFLALFGADSFESELARRAVLRRLRREHPAVDFGTLDSLVEETLAP